ncbi:probable cyclin-dependent serine/threonine-protein kinase DDB_G0292550 isoform X2 [Nilaparvata lugens]|uniref:probable cyclin-dependent serine/threonine-protein kinase DDB_G0292550 isoform X2 n=1 Tax=Nilaparvata lugens TaxID=108931 RepID=UPI00193DD54A|nr:probable cyclin-dependent serine/threonine-protein kinase DDB_G0292550 isoform X2 [Nilaparvata lugens]XP_039296948.1 probable cyclin-dependent serine/threonine-protein kinase DDB_G0292550 isoform X2 [Nilaparvata lugens]
MRKYDDEISKPKFSNEVEDQRILKIVYGLLDAVDQENTFERDSRLMVSFRHFQDLMNMLACNKNDNNLEGRGSFNRNSHQEGRENYGRNSNLEGRNSNQECRGNYSRNSNLEGGGHYSRNSNLEGHGNFSRKRDDYQENVNRNNSSLESRENFSGNLNTLEDYKNFGRNNLNRGGSSSNSNLTGRGSFSRNSNNSEGRDSISRNSNLRDNNLDSYGRKNNRKDDCDNECAGSSSRTSNLDGRENFSRNDPSYSHTNLEGRNFSPAYSQRPRISTPSSETSGVSKIALPAKSTPYGSPRLSSPRIPIRTDRAAILNSPDSISRSLNSSPVRNFEASGLFQHFYANPSSQNQRAGFPSNQKPLINLVNNQQHKPVLKRFNYNGGGKNSGSSSLIPYKNDSFKGYVQRSNDKTVRNNNVSKSENNNFDNEFSKYKPLPAINGMEKNENGSRTWLYQDGGDVDRKKLRRQLTYKVLKPVFVKGPLDMKVGKLGDEKTTPKDRRLAKKLRNKTVVLRGDDLKKMAENQDGGKVGNLRDRLSVRTDLIEAGEKLKKGLSSNENAFWFEM